jgi:hypothetical protein
MSYSDEDDLPKGEIDNNSVSEEEKNEIAREWTIEQEEILQEWAYKAMTYRWLHHRSHLIYRRKNMWYTIPVIILSTLTGTANFSLNRLPQSMQGSAVMIIGGLNLLGGMISTISQFQKISEINEGHRVASIAWDKFYRNVKLELNKSPRERRHPREMLKLSKEEYDRLVETSPMILENVIRKFKNSFNIQELKDKGFYLPEILDELNEINMYDRDRHNSDYMKEMVNLEANKKAIMTKLKQILKEEENNNDGKIGRKNSLNLRNIAGKLINDIRQNKSLGLHNIKENESVKSDEFILEMKPRVSSNSGGRFMRSPTFNVQTNAQYYRVPTGLRGRRRTNGNSGVLHKSFRKINNRNVVHASRNENDGGNSSETDGSVKIIMNSNTPSPENADKRNEFISHSGDEIDSNIAPSRQTNQIITPDGFMSSHMNNDNQNHNIEMSQIESNSEHNNRIINQHNNSPKPNENSSVHSDV